MNGRCSETGVGSSEADASLTETKDSSTETDVGLSETNDAIPVSVGDGDALTTATAPRPSIHLPTTSVSTVTYSPYPQASLLSRTFAPPRLFHSFLIHIDISSPHVLRLPPITPDPDPHRRYGNSPAHQPDPDPNCRYPNSPSNHPQLTNPNRTSSCTTDTSIRTPIQAFLLPTPSVPLQPYHHLPTSRLI